MEDLLIHKDPQDTFPTMIVAFAGWPDASEAATRALKYLVRKLGAKKFGEIDSEGFYDFTMVRPQTRINSDGERIITWPQNDFYFYKNDNPSRNLIVFIGTEPNLRWRTYSQILTNMAQQYGVKLVVSLGALLDAVPHTREPKVTGRASSEELMQKAEWLGIRDSRYQGPTGIHTAFIDACINLKLEHASIWGHCPHYVNSAPDPSISMAILARLRSLIDTDVDLEELRIASDTFREEIDKVISKQPNVSSYVTKLEQKHDARKQSSLQNDIPDPETMVKELENFLKSQSQGSQDQEDDS